jgi:hypothetical protein
MGRCTSLAPIAAREKYLSSIIIIQSASERFQNCPALAVQRWGLNMVDPFTALAAVKAAVSAGQELVNVTKQIGEFFEGVDELRAKHEKKKNSVFSSSDENSMETFVNLQRAKDAEQNLREIIISTRGFSAWGELQAIRVQARKDRKAKIEAERKRKQKLIERIIIYGGSAIAISILIGIAVVVILAQQGRL